MTSAPTCAITLQRSDRDGRNLGQEEMLSLGVHLFNSSDPEAKWMNECVAVLSHSQGLVIVSWE